MVLVDRLGDTFDMAKVQRRNTVRQPTKRVWRRIHLEAWRNKRGMSQELLAEKSGVSTGQISLIETSKSAGSAETLEKLADALKIEVGELFDVEPGEDGSILRLWVKDGDRERVEAMIGALAKIKE